MDAGADPQDLFCCVGCRMASAMVGEGKGAVEFLEARLLLSAFFAMGVMTFSLVLYGEAVYDASNDPGMDAMRAIGRLGLSLFSLPVFLLLGVPLIRGAWLDLKRGVVRMDGLICLATFAAYGLSLRNSFANSGEVYFDTATMVLVLVMFGRRLEANSRIKGRDAATTLAALLPDETMRVDGDGHGEMCAPEELRVGDKVRIAPGEAVPADVRILSGRSEVMEAHISGEHTPRSVVPGDIIHAGATNGTGAVDAEVLRRCGDGSLGRIRRLLDSPLGMTRFMMLADRMAGYLAILAVGLAVVGAWRAAWSDGLGEGVEVALSVLLVACPCALGLATPLAYRAMRAALARRGILVSDPRALEGAALVDKVILDKTGTLTVTMGRLRSVQEKSGNMTRLAALVNASSHPLARAVEPAGLRVDEVEVVPGFGVQGLVEGRRAWVGSPQWMDDLGFSWANGLDEARQKWRDEGATLVALGEEGRVRELAFLEQKLKPSALQVVADLKKQGLDPLMLSGDQERAVQQIARTLNMEAVGGLTPEGKLRILKEMQSKGQCVLVMGDGLNDAPMLRAADVAVAVAEGTMATRAQAGVEILDDDLAHLPFLLRAARRLRRVAQMNVAWTVGYNLIALGLAVTGNLHPLAAAILMIISSMVVCARSYGLLSYGVRE